MYIKLKSQRLALYLMTWTRKCHINLESQRLEFCQIKIESLRLDFLSEKQRTTKEKKPSRKQSRRRMKSRPPWNPAKEKEETHMKFFSKKKKKTRKASPKIEDDLKWSGAPKIWWTIYRAKEERRVAHHCEQNRVTVLHLPGVALSGQLPNGIFGNLTRLCTLSFCLNALTSSLPSYLVACVNLRSLSLQGNLFIGDIAKFL